MAYHFRGVPGAAAALLGVLARQRGRGGWLQTAKARLEAFVISDTNKHIGQQACEQLQGTGFTKPQVYRRREKLAEQVVKIK